MSDTELVPQDARPIQAPQRTLAQLQKDRQSVVQLIKEYMQDGVHYGVVEGTGNKPTLLKPGSEALCSLFMLDVQPEVKIVPLDHPTVAGHREYRIEAMFFHMGTGVRMGKGEGSCSTMESKYRYRSAIELTDTVVPKEYWKLRETEPEKAQALLGGPGHRPKKNPDGQWVVALVKGDEKAENDNPADQYNTVLKMAVKRAVSDGILRILAVSDLFTQDVEDSEAVMKKSSGWTPPAPAASAPPAQPAAPSQPAQPAAATARPATATTKKTETKPSAAPSAVSSQQVRTSVLDVLQSETMVAGKQVITYGVRLAHDKVYYNTRDKGIGETAILAHKNEWEVQADIGRDAYETKLYLLQILPPDEDAP